MKITGNYLLKNIFLGSIGLVILMIVIFSTSILAKYSLIVEISVIGLVLLIFGRLFRRTNNFASGYIGESDIDQEIRKIGKDFLYISEGFDTGKGNIDKIVVGPTGVWTLEVKSHPGNITFDGQKLLRNGSELEKDFLKQAYAEAKTLQENIRAGLGLEIPVQSAVIFSRARLRLGLGKYMGVYVIHKAWLSKLLTETHIHNLDSESVERIADFLKNK